MNAGHEKGAKEYTFVAHAITISGIKETHSTHTHTAKYLIQACIYFRFNVNSSHWSGSSSNIIGGAGIIS